MKKNSTLFKTGKDENGEEGVEKKWSVGVTNGLIKVNCVLLNATKYLYFYNLPVNFI